MKICFLHNNYYRSSGSAIVIRRIYEAASGHQDLDFYFAGCGSNSAGGLKATEDLSWIPNGHYREFGLMTSSAQAPLELFRFIKWLKQIECDVVHVHHRRLACLANAACKLVGIPVFFTAHNTFPWEAWFWAGAPKVVSGVSPSVVQYLKRSTRAKQCLLTWNPYPFSSAPAAADKPKSVWNRAVTVGRLEPVKGQLNLIYAWKRLKAEGLNATLDIYGEGYLRGDLRDKIKAEGLQDRVKLKGFFADLGDQFANSLFNILVSSTEGFPNVVVEAAARDTATLLTDVDGSRDTIPESVTMPNSLTFGDVPQLAETLSYWFRSPEKVIREGHLFRNFLQERCAPEKVLAHYQQIYRGLTSGDLNNDPAPTLQWPQPPGMQSSAMAERRMQRPGPSHPSAGRPV